METSRRLGRATGHWGELIQGLRHGPAGLEHCLLSLPCPDLISEVEITFGPDAVQSAANPKARRAVELALQTLGGDPEPWLVSACSNIAAGKGMGSSTADCTAAVRAVLGNDTPAREIARLVVRAEEASDSTMFAQAVLFAGRSGEVLEDYQVEVPEFAVYGLDTDAAKCMDTDARCPGAEIPPEDLRVLGDALRRSDRAALGEIATRSGGRHQTLLAKPAYEELLRLKTLHRALGLAVAHSGTVCAYLFEPASGIPRDALERDLQSLGIAPGLCFSTTRNGQPKIIQ